MGSRNFSKNPPRKDFTNRNSVCTILIVCNGNRHSTFRIHSVCVVLILLFTPGALLAADNNYAGACGGFAILSGDGRAIAAPAGTSVSLYKPQTGGALNVYVGRHLSDYLSVQGNYIWNSNGLTLTSAAFSSAGEASYQETRSSSQQAFIADLLLYFRRRRSWVRPYLSAGTGVLRLSSREERITALVGSAAPPPRSFTATKAALRVAVGADLKLRRGWSFRYSFSETLSANPISDRLTPRGKGTLKGFHNLFGVVKTF
jgi:hypothetical protein